MGSYKSGRRYRPDRRPTTNEFFQFKISDCSGLKPGNNTLRVSVGQKAIEVKIAWINCYLGGSRPYFLCPQCYRKCGVLYCPVGYELLKAIGFSQIRQDLGCQPLSHIACRDCFGLVYQSQRLGKNERRSPPHSTEENCLVYDFARFLL